MIRWSEWVKIDVCTFVNAGVLFEKYIAVVFEGYN